MQLLASVYDVAEAPLGLLCEGQDALILPQKSFSLQFFKKVGPETAQIPLHTCELWYITQLMRKKQEAGETLFTGYIYIN